MKRAVFLHGTSGNPDDHWWPWLKARFEKSGYEVWAPVLPDNDRPNAETYRKFLMSSEWTFRNNILVGHSSGATSVLNLLARDDFPEIKAAVLVGTFLNENLTKNSTEFDDSDQFINLFPKDGFDWQAIKNKSEKFYFIHGDDDPYCSYADAAEACKIVEGEMITVKDGGHLSASFGVVELPQLTDLLERDRVLS